MNKRKYNVITPLARFENVPKLYEMLKPLDVVWHVIIDDDCREVFPLKTDTKNVILHICPNSGFEFWERCNRSINWFIDTWNIKEDEMYCILNDDDAYDSNFFLELDKCTSDICITSMKRGDSTPPEATGVRAHPTNTLIAEPRNMHIGGVGVEQIVLCGKVLSRYRLPIHQYGDGMWITRVVEENPVEYVPTAFALFNFYEPGRWKQK